MEYTIITTESAEDLIEQVNEHIGEGWKPQGSIAFHTHYSLIYQAMVRDR
jgi:hypothetical protein